MVENIIYYAITTGAISGIIIFLGRKIISNYFSKNLEEYKAGLEKMRLEHQIMFSKLHEKRALVIEELFSKLVKATESIEFFINVHEISEQSQREKFAKITLDKFNEFKAYYSITEIYFHDDIVRLIEEIIKKILTAWNYSVLNIKYEKWDGLPESKRSEITDLQMKNWNVAWEAIEGDLPLLKEKLKKEFKNLLGV